jgi:hypothetical protein
MDVQSASIGAYGRRAMVHSKETMDVPPTYVGAYGCGAMVRPKDTCAALAPQNLTPTIIHGGGVMRRGPVARPFGVWWLGPTTTHLASKSTTTDTSQ